MPCYMDKQNEWKALIEDRNRGILTPADREFLSGKKELTDQSVRDARYRIRNRTKNGLRDIGFLDRFLEKRDRTPIGKALFEEDEYSKANLSRILAFPFRLLVEISTGVEEGKEKLEDSLRTALRTVTRQYLDGDYLINVDVDITIDYHQPAIENLLRKYENDKESRKELQFLREKGAITVGKDYYRHVLRHSWEEGQGFAVPNKEGEMRVLEVSDYDSQEEYIEEGLTALQEIEFLNSE